MKKIKSFYVTLGFLAGIVFVVACGANSGAIADAIGDAFDVLFDNSGTTLQADNMQSAIEELSAKVDALENSNNYAADIVGTWKFEKKDLEGDEITITFNADGTYYCNKDSNLIGNCFSQESIEAAFAEYGAKTTEYKIKGNIINFKNLLNLIPSSHPAFYNLAISDNEMWLNGTVLHKQL